MLVLKFLMYKIIFDDVPFVFLWYTLYQNNIDKVVFIMPYLFYNFFIFRVSDMLDYTAEELTSKSMYCP